MKARVVSGMRAGACSAAASPTAASNVGASGPCGVMHRCRLAPAHNSASNTQMIRQGFPFQLGLSAGHLQHIELCRKHTSKTLPKAYEQVTSQIHYVQTKSINDTRYEHGSRCRMQ